MSSDAMVPQDDASAVLSVVPLDHLPVSELLPVDDTLPEEPTYTLNDLGEVFATHRNSYLRQARGVLFAAGGNTNLAEDAVQEGFLDVFTRFTVGGKELDEQGASLLGLLGIVTRRRAIDQVRNTIRVTNHQASPDERDIAFEKIEAAVGNPEEIAMQTVRLKQYRDLLLGLVATLTVTEKNALVVHYQNQDNEGTAATGASRAALHRARVKARHYLQELYGGTLPNDASFWALLNRYLERE